MGTPSVTEVGVASALPIRHRGRAHTSAGTRLPPAASAPGLGSPRPHLLRPLSASSSATRVGAALPHLHQDLAQVAAQGQKNRDGHPRQQCRCRPWAACVDGQRGCARCELPRARVHHSPCPLAHVAGVCARSCVVFSFSLRISDAAPPGFRCTLRWVGATWPCCTTSRLSIV